jgi:glutamyl-tRNA synthetase
MTVRVRIAPSPTGDPHVGTAYIALFNLIFARHHQGKFILRIEDTDQTRSRPEYEQSIFDALNWMNIHWDEGPDVGGPYGPYRQSERTEIYREYVQKLLDNGKAYKCFATPEELAEMREVASKLGKKVGYDRRYRNLSEEEIKQKEAEGLPYVVRLKIPLKGDCVYEDAIKGKVVYPWADVDDQILLKSDGFPTYHLANVVDDYLMKITHVIRGDEWMSSTPKHIYLYEAFGFTPPVFMHMPLLLGADGRKLSKRRSPTSIFFYKETGYLPEACVNFLTLMGYSLPSEQEIYTLDQIIESFDHKRIGVSGAFFDVKKLDWVNQQYLINSLDESALLDRLKQWQFNDDYMKKLMPLCHTRIKTFSDFIELCGFFFTQNIPYTTEILCPKGLTAVESASVIQALIWALDELEDWNRSGVEKASHLVAERFGLNHKKVIIALLYAAISGKTQGPPIYDSFQILGKARARARFLRSIEFLGGISKNQNDKLTSCWKSGDCKPIIASKAT